MVKARDPLKTFLYPLNFTTWNTTHPALNSTSIVKTMLTRLFLRPNSVILSPTHFFLFPKLSLTKPTIASNALPYGPSLRKGKTSLNCPQQKQRRRQQQQEYQSLSGPKPLYQCKEDQEGEKEEEPDDVNVINEDDFTRVFDIAALRVPAKDCFSLESRIRGHLLNWPRIRNIARVPGDEMEESMVSLLGEKGSEDEENFDAFNRRIYGKAEGDGEELSPVLFREKLANEFNSRGFIKFRNLAKISRPKRKKKKKMGGKGEEGEENERERRDGFSVVEVVEEEEGGDWKGLLGDEFKGRGKWMGSTRLLLLDERYAEKGVDELPQAIKAVAQEAMRGNSTSTFNLVRCKLTLFYDYWQMNEILEALLPRDMIIPSAFETVGHIAHLNLRDEHLPYKKLIAKVVLDKNKPKIQTVVNKIDAIHNDYRTMQLEVLAGNHSLVTMVVENGLRFHVDLAAVYWNSRLASERQRLLNGFTRNDVLCDVFAGVGPIALSAAKIVKHVYANDLNPCAVQYMEKNSVLNKLERHIEIFNMDGRRFIDAMYASQKAQSITQVVMNLPNDAVEYLDAFRGICKDKPKDKEYALPMIHVYGFSKARDPEFDFHERIRIALQEVAVNVEMRRVRQVAPGKWMLCASFRLPISVAYAHTMSRMQAHQVKSF
ncbi:tRNA (guanine(37)-N1)-methyltransferase 1 [Populus alba x Populus x berolinensis]|uniref:tRNA (guanine(37)-N1)-methyltransferase n=1 Tax=Populus alba x Populus x berolinensis TaxID=444605 RepID=A0AAD6M7R2_9ROSI|nr:tRNA (guanine(37)-N1)-methyltransferase 1 [Populus alba x Populus x berolinensis]